MKRAAALILCILIIFALAPRESEEEISLQDELVCLAKSPAISTTLSPIASGKKVSKNDKAIIDYSNSANGYIMIKSLITSGKRVKIRVIKEDTYTYEITKKDYETFPLSMGNGKYQIKVYEQTTGTRYAVVLSLDINVKLKNEQVPFLTSNQYVNFDSAKNTITKAKELTKSQTKTLKKVEKVYSYVINNFKYDTAKANTVQSGYLPDLDKVLKDKKGICFDYAALMAGMLRSQGIPCKLVIGYAGSIYHAWVSVYNAESGQWIDKAIYFDGKTWNRMDPTFSSSGKSSKQILRYIDDDKNYTEKYLY